MGGQEHDSVGTARAGCGQDRNGGFRKRKRDGGSFGRRNQRNRQRGGGFFWTGYQDSRGWKYKVMGGIGGEAFKARYQEARHRGEYGWHGVVRLPWRPTFAEAQDDLDRMASAKGWREWEESDAPDNRNDT